MPHTEHDCQWLPRRDEPIGSACCTLRLISAPLLAVKHTTRSDVMLGSVSPDFGCNPCSSRRSDLARVPTAFFGQDPCKPLARLALYEPHTEQNSMLEMHRTECSTTLVPGILQGSCARKAAVKPDLRQVVHLKRLPINLAECFLARKLTFGIECSCLLPGSAFLAVVSRGVLWPTIAFMVPM